MGPKYNLHFGGDDPDTGPSSGEHYFSCMTWGWWVYVTQTERRSHDLQIRYKKVTLIESPRISFYIFYGWCLGKLPFFGGHYYLLFTTFFLSHSFGSNRFSSSETASGAPTSSRVCNVSKRVAETPDVVFPPVAQPSHPGYFFMDFEVKRVSTLKKRTKKTAHPKKKKGHVHLIHVSSKWLTW